MKIFLAFSLLFSASAFADIRNMRGFIFNRIKGTAFFAVLADDPRDEAVIYLLHGINDALEKELETVPLNDSYEIRMDDYRGTNDGFKHAIVFHVKPINFALIGSNLEEPDPENPSTVPPLKYDDYRLPARAHLYEHFLSSPAWVRKYRQAGASQTAVDVLRKTVLANTILSEFPTYPWALHIKDFEAVINVSAELWGLGDSFTLRLIRGMIEEAFDQHLTYDPAQEKQFKRAGSDKPCQRMLHHTDLFVGPKFKNAKILRAKLMTTLQNAAEHMPTLAIDPKLRFLLK